MNTEFGQSSRKIFAEGHKMISDPYDLFIRGEYHSTKRTLTESFSGSAPMDQRLQQLVLEKLLADYRPIRESDENAKDINGFEKFTAEWWHRNRRLLYHWKTSSFEDGKSFAKEVEDLVAQNVQYTAMPNLGRMEDSFDDTKNKELKILADQALPK